MKWSGAETSYIRQLVKRTLDHLVSQFDSELGVSLKVEKVGLQGNLEFLGFLKETNVRRSFFHPRDAVDDMGRIVSDATDGDKAIGLLHGILRHFFDELFQYVEQTGRIIPTTYRECYNELQT